MQFSYNFFGSDAQFHHIGIAVESIKSVVSSNNIIIDHYQNVAISFILLNGINIELIEPITNNSPISQSIKKGRKLQHICFEVNDLHQTIRYCRKYQFHCIGRPTPAKAFNDRKIAWIYNKQLGLFELLEKVKS